MALCRTCRKRETQLKTNRTTGTQFMPEDCDTCWRERRFSAKSSLPKGSVHLCKVCGKRKRILLPYLKPDGSEGRYLSRFCATCRNAKWSLAASEVPMYAQPNR